jgi:hypothetical protein
MGDLALLTAAAGVRSWEWLSRPRADRWQGIGWDGRVRSDAVPVWTGWRVSWPDRVDWTGGGLMHTVAGMFADPGEGRRAARTAWWVRARAGERVGTWPMRGGGKGWRIGPGEEHAARVWERARSEAVDTTVCDLVLPMACRGRADHLDRGKVDVVAESAMVREVARHVVTGPGRMCSVCAGDAGAWLLAGARRGGLDVLVLSLADVNG